MSLKSAPWDFPPNELALEDERSRFTTPRNDDGLRGLVDCVERDSSLLLLLGVGCGDSSALDVDGRDSDSCCDFFVHDMERRIQDGDNRSFDVALLVDMTSSDIDEDWGTVDVGVFF